jgi:outer membrane lipoprotein SlyB
MTKSRSVLAISLVTLLVSCSSLDKRTIGTIGGGILGAAAGTQVGQGRGRILAVLAGAAAGAYVGSRIGSRLDERDRNKMAEATRTAAESGQTQAFRNDSTGLEGRAEVIDSQTRPIQVQGGKTEPRECRTVKQTIRTQGYPDLQDNVVTCKGPNGWEVAS